MAEVIVVRLEQYPPDEPVGWAVGFNVVCNNGRNFYIDTVVDFKRAKIDEEAIEVALEELKETIQNKINELESKPLVLGKKFTL
jgi:hypothetical protein